METLFLPQISLKISDVFFDVKQKGYASVGYWVNYVTLTFDLTHDLDFVVDWGDFRRRLAVDISS